MESMVKKIVFTSFILGCVSCSSILDKAPLDKYTENDVWSNVETAQAFLYPSLQSISGALILHDRWSDNDIIQEKAGDSNLNKEAIDNYYDAGWNVYNEIRNCNIMIEKMTENTSFLEKDRKYLLAQAKALRGMLYFTRARLFGKLMIVDHVLDINEDMEIPRTKTIKETYDFILKDLSESIDDLPVSDEGKKGILTKGVVYALMAEVALHGAAYIEEGQNDYYLLAKQSSENLFNLGIYELDSDYGKMFNDFDYASNSKEIIFAHWRHEINTSFTNTWMMDFVPNASNDKITPDAYPRLSDNFEGWISTFPSCDLVDDYLVIDSDGKAKKWNETSYYMNWLEKGGYVSNAIYKNRDARFYATVVHDSTKYFNSIVTMREGGNLHWDSHIGTDWGSVLSGYMYRKGLYTGRRVYYNQPTYYHYVLMRLGRSYLNYAEIMLRLGDVKTAIEYINKVRTKHGNLPEIPLILSETEAWDVYKRERRVELVHEGDRYWSLLRWAKADGKETIDELNKEHHSILISSDGKKFEIINLPYRANENERIFTKKRFLFPVPQGERVLNSKLDQNEGW